MPAILDEVERALARALLAASVLASFACTEGAPASPSAGVAIAVTPAFTEDAGADAGVAIAIDPCADAGDRGDGATFTDLYRDFFGPTGLASCSARSICHVPGGTGAQTSGYLCSPDQESCWASMTSTIIPDGGSSIPEDTPLYKALRKAPPSPGTGPMPRNSTFAFCPRDLERIKEWIGSGGAND